MSVDLLDVALAVAMVALAIGLSRWQRLGLGSDIAVAAVRAFVQLMLIGYVIHLIFRSGALALVVAMIGAMVLFAAITSARRMAGLPGRFFIALAAIGLASLATLGIMLALGIIPATPAYLIPIGGMLVGNSMNVASVTAMRLIEDSVSERATIEAGLALSASPRRALRPVFRRSVRLAMVPTIDSTRTIGIVFLPGAMTGMIIAGADPLVAVRLQVVIMYMIIAAVTVTAVTTALLVARALFTPAQQLRRLTGNGNG